MTNSTATQIDRFARGQQLFTLGVHGMTCETVVVQITFIRHLEVEKHHNGLDCVTRSQGIDVIAKSDDLYVNRADCLKTLPDTPTVAMVRKNHARQAIVNCLYITRGNEDENIISLREDLAELAKTALVVEARLDSALRRQHKLDDTIDNISSGADTQEIRRDFPLLFED